MPRRFICSDRGFLLQDDVSRVDLLVNEEGRYAGFRFPVDDRPVDRCDRRGVLSLHHLFSLGTTPDRVRGSNNARKGIEILTRSIEWNPDFSGFTALSSANALPNAVSFVLVYA